MSARDCALCWHPPSAPATERTWLRKQASERRGREGPRWHQPTEGKVTMGYVKHIGRIGALAVALGVGAVVAGTPAIGYASPVDADSATRDSSTSTSDSAAGGASTNASPPAAGTSNSFT